MTNNTLKTNILTVLNAIRSNGGSISARALFALIYLTNRVVAPTIVRLIGYVSDKSEMNEIADKSMQLGVKYGNALKSTAKKLEELDAEDMTAIAETCTEQGIKGFRYINRKGLTVAEYCKAVVDALPLALAEMLDPKKRENNVIKLNDILWYNINTGNLLLFGEMIAESKIVTAEGCPACGKEIVKGTLVFVADHHANCPHCGTQFGKDFTKKGAKTVAKQQINAYLNTRTSKVRTHKVVNLQAVAMLGEKVELNIVG
jgi:transposase-like protein